MHKLLALLVIVMGFSAASAYACGANKVTTADAGTTDQSKTATSATVNTQTVATKADKKASPKKEQLACVGNHC